MIKSLLGNVLKFAGGLFGSPSSIIWVVASAIIGLAYLYHTNMANNYEKTKEELTQYKVALDSAAKTIELKNKEALDNGEKSKRLQKGIDKTESDNKKLRDENNAQKEELLNRPLPQNCDETVAELKTTAKKVADEWNKPKP